MMRAQHPTSGVRPFEAANCADLGDVGPNPADLMDVIGVGGVTNSLRMAPFSSRGMTTHEGELTEGYLSYPYHPHTA